MRSLWRFACHNAFESTLFGKDGAVCSPNPHIHSILGTLAGLIKYGTLAANMRFVELGRTVFDWAYHKAGRFGWIPESLREEEVCETCSVADMAECAILLARAGYREYWNHAKRIIRNQLVENQLREVSWIAAGKMDDLDMQIADRAMGSFAGWSLPNDFVSGEKSSTMADGVKYEIQECCTLHALHELYVA